MKLCITGANGFIGQYLSRQAIAQGFSVVKAVRSRANDDEIGVGEIGPLTEWSEALVSCNTVVHLAARVHVMRPGIADISDFAAVNTEGTLNLARQATKAGVRRFVFLSSIKVNGEETQPGVPFTAEDSPNPLDAYAMSKYEAECGLLALAEKTGLEVVIIRPPLVYGPGVKANFRSMMRWLAKGLPLPLGSIHNARSLVGLDNLVSLILVCLIHPGATNRVFLVSDGEDVSTTELLCRTATAMGRAAWLFPVPASGLQVGARLLGKEDVARRLCGNLQVDISKTCDLLGWHPPFSLDEELRRTVQVFLHETVV